MGTPISHLLLLPQDTSPADVEALIVTRHPEVTREQNHVLRIAPQIVSFGPLHTVVPTWMGVPSDFDQPLDTSAFTPSLAEAVHRMPTREAQQRPLIFTFTTLRDREQPVPQPFPHPDGLHYLYSDGYPQGSERDTIDLMIAIARRLGGAYCCGETGHVLTPDPMCNTDLTVYSPYWLAPIELGQAIGKVTPSAKLETDPTPWYGPAADAQESIPKGSVSTRLSGHEAAKVAARAERFDEEALAGGDQIDGYQFVLQVGRRGEDGIIEARVGAQEILVPALAGTNWSDRVVSYEVVWSPVDHEQLELPHPTSEYLRSRERAQHLVRQITACINETVNGVIVDSDGFIVHPDWLG